MNSTETRQEIVVGVDPRGDRPPAVAGSPVEVLAEAGEHALGIVVGRLGEGGYTGMRVGSVVHGLLHRAHCPVITVPAL
ncbi:hypothetical protein EES46_31395 [Streptomyces sp. ADI98-10]|nr:hypothetical protein EES46_31395 [Streptomyces sp. ADI98-10]